MKSLSIPLDIQEILLFLSKAFYFDLTILDQESAVLYQISDSTYVEDESKSGKYDVDHQIIMDDHLYGSMLLTFHRPFDMTISDSIENLVQNLECLILSSITKENLEKKSIILKSSMDIIEQGIVYTSSEGIIICHNRSAAMLFNEKQSLDGMNIRKFIGKLDAKNGVSGLVNSREFFTFEKGFNVVKGFYIVKRIQKSHDAQDFLFRFDKMDAYSKKYPNDDKSQRMTTFDDIIGKSKEIQEVKDQVAKLWRGKSTILINGESGTGKELFARVIHCSSDRRESPFIAINCAAIPESLLESELFGYEEGAFTGAKKGGKLGKFELANNGTIFLDEIGDMKISLQAKLLRVLQENVIERIGGKELIPINVRVISATHEELHEKVENGSFRKDLFYRISVIPIRIPPLRDRKEDILIIARVFLERFNYSMGKNISGFNEEVENCLYNYLWSGNVRELENVVEFAVNMTDTNLIQMEDLPVRFNDASHRDKSLFESGENSAIIPIEVLEKAEIQKALKYYGKNKKGIIQAADALGVSVSTLYRRIRLHQLSE